MEAYKWKVIQPVQCKIIGSRETAEQSVTLILLLKFSMICLDLWDFHSKILHTSGGPLAVAPSTTVYIIKTLKKSLQTVVSTSDIFEEARLSPF